MSGVDRMPPPRLRRAHPRRTMTVRDQAPAVRYPAPMTRQGNPKDSKWRSTPNAARVNKNVMLTLPPEEREKLDRLAKAWGCPRSVAVARLVREAEEPAVK